MDDLWWRWVAYGEMIFSLHRGCMGDNSSGIVVGVLAWYIAHVWHTRVNTSVGSVYVFLDFHDIKTYICIIKRTLMVSDLVWPDEIQIMFSKSICSIKQHWWSLTLSCPDEDQKMVFDRPWAFKCKIDTTNDFNEFFYIIDMTFTLLYYT